VILLALLACGAPKVPDQAGEDTAVAGGDTDAPPGDTDGGEDTDPPPEDTGVYIYDDDASPPDVDLEDVANELNAALSEIWIYNTVPAFRAYDSLLARADSRCPEFTSGGTAQYWSDNCTTSAGVAFDGYISNYGSDRGGGMQGSATIKTPEGYTFRLTGEITYNASSSETQGTWSSTIDGTVAWDGEEGQGTWLDGTGPGSKMNLYAHTDPYEGSEVLLSGGVVEMEGAVEALVFLGESALYEDGLCPQELSGDVSALVNGIWIDLFFDGPATLDGEIDADLCDGCGEAWAEGYLLGEICLDFGVLFDWGDAPF
jgi:hypothetical protein